MPQPYANKKILLGVCGGVAAYKSVELARLLKQLGAQVQVVMTESAQEFVGPQTFQAVTGFPVTQATNDASFAQSMAHIDLSRWADILIIAPATANFMAKMAHGMADDLLSLLCLMVKVPILVCPAMNVHMWQHPATQQNMKLLKERGVVMVGPDEGEQACGDVGAGRMREPQWILNAMDLWPIADIFSGTRFVLTAGPTREMIDPIRFISNKSSGLMGYALAEALAFAGAEVELVTGPCACQVPAGVRAHRVETAKEMYQKVLGLLTPEDIFVGVAAVSDFTLGTPATQKIKKQNQSHLVLELEPSPDILMHVKQQQLAKCVVGFAAETENLLEHARQKLEKKADIIIANDVSSGRGFESVNNAVTIVTSKGEVYLPATRKLVIAKQIVEFLKQEL